MTRTHINNPYALVLAIGLALTAIVVGSTWLGIPPTADARAAIYAAFGVGGTMIVAFNHEQISRQLQNFLMARVNSTAERTDAMIELCSEARGIFRAVTLFPVVGIQDDPCNSPGDYLHQLEIRLEEGTEVMLISMSYSEARDYCLDRELERESLDMLKWVEGRLNEFERRFDRFTRITVPRNHITVNLCHNDQKALIYHIGANGDQGAGFQSNDPFVVAVVRGGITRYATASLREGQ